MVNIHKETQAMIHEALKGLDTYIGSDEKKVCDLSDILLHLREKIAKAHEELDDYHELIKKSKAEFKEAKAIIVENMPKKKKHKVKLEED